MLKAFHLFLSSSPRGETVSHFYNQRFYNIRVHNKFKIPEYSQYKPLDTSFLIATSNGMAWNRSNKNRLKTR